MPRRTNFQIHKCVMLTTSDFAKIMEDIIKCPVNVTVDDDGDVHCVEQEGFCDIGDIECRRLLRFAYNYDMVGIYGIYRKYGSFVGIQLDATGLGKIKL